MKLLIVLMLLAGQHSGKGYKVGDTVALVPKKVTLKTFGCRDGNAALENDAGKTSNISVIAPEGKCPVISTNRIYGVKINGQDYEWCGPTKNGMTPCLPQSKKLASIQKLCKGGDGIVTGGGDIACDHSTGAFVSCMGKLSDHDKEVCAEEGRDFEKCVQSPCPPTLVQKQSQPSCNISKHDCEDRGVIKIYSSGMDDVGVPPAKEPMDVPAIQEGKETCFTLEHDLPINQIPAGSKICSGYYWTCPKDSSRILLTDVDGGHHCISFKGR